MHAFGKMPYVTAGEHDERISEHGIGDSARKTLLKTLTSLILGNGRGGQKSQVLRIFGEHIGNERKTVGNFVDIILFECEGEQSLGILLSYRAHRLLLYRR